MSWIRRVGLMLGGLVTIGAASCAAPPPESTRRSDSPAPAQTPAASEPARTSSPEAATTARPAPEPAPAPPPAPPPLPPAKETVEVPLATEEFRPPWWLPDPVVRDGEYSVAASADAATVRDSRRAALMSGESRAPGRAGLDPGEPEVKAIRTVRLPSGYYRTFVLMSWPAREGGR